jgi:hypothetical protein
VHLDQFVPVEARIFLPAYEAVDDRSFGRGDDLPAVRGQIEVRSEGVEQGLGYCVGRAPVPAEGFVRGHPVANAELAGSA